MKEDNLQKKRRAAGNLDTMEILGKIKSFEGRQVGCFEHEINGVGLVSTEKNSPILPAGRNSIK